MAPKPGFRYALKLICAMCSHKRDDESDRYCSGCVRRKEREIEVVTMHSTSWLVTEFEIMRLFGDLKNATIEISRFSKAWPQQEATRGYRSQETDCAYPSPVQTVDGEIDYSRRWD